MPKVSLSNVASPYGIDLSALAPNLDPPLPERVPGALQRQCPALTRFPRSTIALEEQLGLQLKSQRAPVEVLVIDHVEKPTEN